MPHHHGGKYTGQFGGFGGFGSWHAEADTPTTARNHSGGGKFLRRSLALALLAIIIQTYLALHLMPDGPFDIHDLTRPSDGHEII